MCVPLAKSATAQPRELPLNRWVSLVPSLSDLAFLMPMLVLFWCTTGVGWFLTDSDTGWHIRTGEWILKHGRIPATDLFSFTKFGQPWFAWEWLSDVSMAAVHSHFGLGGIVLVSLLALGATSLCIYRNTVEEFEHRLIAISLAGLAMAASTVHWLARPHLVTPLFAAVFCWVLNRVESGNFRVFEYLFGETGGDLIKMYEAISQLSRIYCVAALPPWRVPGLLENLASHLEVQTDLLPPTKILDLMPLSDFVRNLIKPLVKLPSDWAEQVAKLGQDAVQYHIYDFDEQ